MVAVLRLGVGRLLVAVVGGLGLVGVLVVVAGVGLGSGGGGGARGAWLVARMGRVGVRFRWRRAVRCLLGWARFSAAIGFVGCGAGWGSCWGEGCGDR